MPTVHIEHPVRDFDSWKAAFERDPAGRQQSGVRRYRIFRPIDDPNYVMIDLDFDNSREADAFLAKMREVWSSPQVAPGLIGSPTVRIVETVDTKEY